MAFSMPKAAALTAIAQTTIDSNSVITERQRAALDAKLTVTGQLLHGKNDDERAAIYFGFALMAADIGSSALTNYPGNTPIGNVNANALAAAIKSVGATVRQFCMYYAAAVYEFYRANPEKYPANWVRMGATEETKRVAFDFSFGITHAAALKPNGNVSLSPAELTMIATIAAVKVFRSRQQAGPSSANFVEVHGGRVTAPPVRLALPAPPNN